MQWIRWWGLGVFAAIVGGVVALWVLFADTVVEWAVESAGTRVVGARVELAQANVGFSPARLELSGLAVTNPKAPMENAVEAERIAFDIDWIGLLLDRTHIDDVSVQGVRFGTARDTSGAIGTTERRTERSQLLARARDKAQIPPLEVPSAQEVLEREQLESPQVIADSRETMGERRRELEARLAELPGEAALQRHRQRLAELEGGDDLESRLKAAKRTRDLVEAVRDDLDALRSARDEVKSSVAAADRTVAEARNAPRADIQRLYRKYTDAGAVAGELVHYLLGPRVAGWINKGWYWHEQVSPYLGRGDAGADATQTVPATRRPGRNVIYPEADTEPGVLVRRVAISGAAGGGELDGRITDIAAPATMWGEPLRLNLTGQSISGISRLRLDGMLDRRSADAAVSRIDLDATGTEMAGLGLGPEGGIRSSRGAADFRVTGGVRGDDVDLELDAVLRGASFAADDEVEPVLREVVQALGNAKRIEIAARVTGTLESPELALTSSLKGIIAPILRDRLERAAGGFREELAAAVTGRTSGALEELTAATEAIDGLQQRLTERIEGFEKLLDRVRKR
jgi:uncharacterized protein (TIGR03545 family)